MISGSPSNKSLNVESDFVNPLNLKLVSEMRVILVGIAPSNFSVGLNLHRELEGINFLTSVGNNTYGRLPVRKSS